MMFLKALLLFVLPALVLWGGGQLLNSIRLADAQDAPAHTAQAENVDPSPPGEKPPVNMRLRGYTQDDVAQQWGKNSGKTERRVLLYDLAFPLFYGGALCLALWLAWSDLGRPFAPAWLLAPVLLGMLADWVENLIHLNQLSRYVQHGPTALNSNWIQLASWATSLKLALVCTGFLLLAALSLWLMLRKLIGRS